MSADSRAASILFGRLVPVDVAMLVQTRGGPAEFPGDSLLPQEADSGLNLRTHFCESVRKTIHAHQQQQRRGPNQLQSAEKHPDCFLDRFCMCGSNFSIADNLIHRVEESSMPKHIKVWDALWPLKYYCSTRFI